MASHIFLKYISDSFEEHRAKLVAGKGDYAGANPEDQDEYKAENVFWVPPVARWSYLQANARQPTIGKTGDTLVSIRTPVGDINMANEEGCIGRGVAAVLHNSSAISFTYHSMANLYPDFARFETEGTVFGSINKDSFKKLHFVIPPDEIVAAYERHAGPLDEQICILENQSPTLATLHDTLLPKLLSGEVQPTQDLCQEQ